MSEGVFTLISSSEKRFDVDKQKAQACSGTLRGLIEDGYEEAPCPDIDDDTMEYVFRMILHEKWMVIDWSGPMITFSHVCNACLYLDMKILRCHTITQCVQNFFLQDRTNSERHEGLASGWALKTSQVYYWMPALRENQRGYLLNLLDWENITWERSTALVEDHAFLRILHKDVWKNYFLPALKSYNGVLLKLALTHPILFECVQYFVAQTLRKEYPDTTLTDSQLMCCFLLAQGFRGLKNYYFETEAKQIFCLSSKVLTDMMPSYLDGKKSFTSFRLLEAVFKKHGTLKACIAEREKREKRSAANKEKRRKKKQEEQELKEAKKLKWVGILRKEPTLNSDIIESVQRQFGFDLNVNEITPKNKTVKTIVESIRKRGRECVEQSNWNLAYALLSPQEFARVVQDVVSKRPKR